MAEPEKKRKKLSDNAEFLLSGMPRAERERALREKSPEELDKAGAEVRSALAEDDERQ
ncbi:hypothetical protein [Streptomyces sp. NPDC049585]|uniref:hypothetical protein n=1 Tax=Streptomyces sp. NPDC049585 TaxID=3155154 RepID=UPI003420B338